MATNNNEFLCRRMKELREKNGLTMEDMAKRLNKANKSSISRVESGKTSYSALIDLAKEYCETFKMDKVQTEQFLRGEKIVIPDTSALLKNIQLIDELSVEYSKVVIAKVVITELTGIKNYNTNNMGKKAYEILKEIGSNAKTITREYTGDPSEEDKDYMIIHIAKEVSDEFGCVVDIISNDVDYSAYLKGNNTVRSLFLGEYRAKKQKTVNFIKIQEIDKYYAESYDECPIPTKEEANAYFNNGDPKMGDGSTLIISTVRNRNHTLEERKAKIKWLISYGANVNKRDCNRRYFPPLTHAVQMSDYDMFIFLLKECHANPNVGSKNPHSAKKIYQKSDEIDVEEKTDKNEGNMPLMVAAWDGKEDFVKALCEDPRTSINQQDANGFTALIKACGNLNIRCRDILLEYGADTKIVDINGKNYEKHIDDAYKYGRLRDRGRNKGNRNKQRHFNK